MKWLLEDNILNDWNHIIRKNKAIEKIFPRGEKYQQFINWHLIETKYYWMTGYFQSNKKKINIEKSDITQLII